MSKFACNENGLSKKNRLLFALAVVVSLCFGYGHCWEQDLMFSLGINDDHLVIGARGGFDPKVYYRVLDYPYTARYAAIEKDFEEDPGRALGGPLSVPPLFVFGHGRSTRQRLC